MIDIDYDKIKLKVRIINQEW